jgi:tetratricopeptide (TPR) repeat protein
MDPKLAISYYNRGTAYGAKGENDKAVADYTAAIKCKPTFAEAYCNRSFVYWSKGVYDRAIADSTEAARLGPRNGFSHNNLAWFLATCPEERFRDRKRAVLHATQACELTQWKDWRFVSTLAAACAEAGKFDKAVEFQQRALAMVTKDADKERLQERLSLYRDGKPYREPIKQK